MRTTEKFVKHCVQWYEESDAGRICHARHRSPPINVEELNANISTPLIPRHVPTEMGGDLLNV